MGNEECPECMDLVSPKAEKICLARREAGICPQLTVLEKLEAQITWLTESKKMENLHNCTPEELRKAAEDAVCG